MPYASLSLDLDNQWSYMQTNGLAGWDEFPSYFDLVVPRMLDFFARHRLRITFFIVGQDAALQKNHAALKAIVAAGHELGNHSHRHQPWLHEYSLEELERELDTAEKAIHGATGVRVSSFRGPGYSYSADVLRVLARRGYRFDASSFPNSVNSLLRLYFFRHNRVRGEEADRRKELFGKSTEMFRPVDPYLWKTAEGELLEIPVTTMPITRLPMHFSYILFLGTYSEALAMAYFRVALKLCRWTGVEPSLLFHPLDFMGRDDRCDAVSIFPGMNQDAAPKIALLDRCMDVLCKEFECVPMLEHADKIRAAAALPLKALPA